MLTTNLNNLSNQNVIFRNQQRVRIMYEILYKLWSLALFHKMTPLTGVSLGGGVAAVAVGPSGESLNAKGFFELKPS